MINRILLVTASILSFNSIIAQDNSIHLTTGVGVNKIQGRLGNTFKSTIAFNSGFEKQFAKNWFAQLEANFNTLKYDQQEKDDNSSYLFRNTNSSLFMVTANGGKDFRFGSSRWFSSLYLGGGYVNIGEPRLAVDEVNNVITQSVVRRGGALAKGGGRIGVNTGSKFFQTLYIDGSYWTSTLKSQGLTLNSVSVFLGMRMAMH